MDVDEDEEGTQQPLKPRDYGLVVDFADLADEDKEVRRATSPRRAPADVC